MKLSQFDEISRLLNVRDELLRRLREADTLEGRACSIDAIWFGTLEPNVRSGQVKLDLNPLDVEPSDHAAKLLETFLRTAREDLRAQLAVVEKQIGLLGLDLSD